MNLKKIASLIFAFIIATACLSGCGSFNSGNNVNQPEASELERFSDVYYDAFDTVINIIAYCENQDDFDALTKQVHEELLYYHELFDIYKTYDGKNNARTINKNAGKKPVEVSEDLIDLLEFSIEMYEKTGGRVNVAMGAVLSLWHEAREASTADESKAYIPSEFDLKAAAEHGNIQDVIIDRQAGTVFLADEEMSIDLGAVAKGWATEKIVQKLESQGITNFVISAGGNVRASGLRADGTKWVVAVQNPNLTAATAYVDTVELSDNSLVTSGVYQRYFEYQGKNYHHIIDSETLMPEDRFLSVSIITKDSGYADALSTAVFNMDLDDGKAYIESLEGVEAFWVLPDESRVKSSGWISRE